MGLERQRGEIQLGMRLGKHHQRHLKKQMAAS